MKQFLGDGQEMGTPQGTPTKIKPTNTIKNHILKMQIQITPAHQTFGKGHLRVAFFVSTKIVSFFKHSCFLKSYYIDYRIPLAHVGLQTR
ncbi:MULTISPECIES: hypothetical protein [Vibrio]|uniref:hypothetical protein n=1 Tax=Vibrio TaxID=662 RepID=UPI001881E9D6|nr:MULTISPECIES: hypothetical protein [Vibrio]MBE8568392.1 hypothetical protein [Vibrio sp. OPT46]MBE8580572.1 hypothetical protein [Vibrio sp. OPT41]MCQ9061315.1 hypothetical protein [Vibrio alginolyticus]MCS0252604.1 hypothetical protein [Vibrio alginolyticus]